MKEFAEEIDQTMELLKHKVVFIGKGPGRKRLYRCVRCNQAVAVSPALIVPPGFEDGYEVVVARINAEECKKSMREKMSDSKMSQYEQTLIDRLALVKALEPFTMLSEEHNPLFIKAHDAALERAKEAAEAYANSVMK